MMLLAISAATLAMLVWLYALTNIAAAARSSRTYRPPPKAVSVGLPAVALLANAAVALIAYQTANNEVDMLPLAGMGLAVISQLGFLVRPKKKTRR